MIVSRAKIERFSIAAAVMFLAMTAMWWMLWSLAASQYRTFIDGWIAAHRMPGYQVTYDRRETVGFPRDISLHFTNFVLQNPDGVRIHANDVSLSAFPWQWERFDAKLKHGFELTIPFGGSKILLIGTDQTAHNHTELGDNGDWQFVDLRLTNARALWGSEPFFSAGAFVIALTRPDHPPENHNETGLTLSASVDTLTLPQDLSAPFGPNVAKIDIALHVLGPVPDPRRKESVAAWNSDAGTTVFDKFFLTWGPLIFAAKGTLGLDDDLQPEGVFSSQIGNHEKVLKTLMTYDYIPKHEAGMLDSALNLFAKKSTVAGTPGIDVPITVQLGGLFLGPVRIFEFPEIEWEPVATPLPSMFAPIETSPAAPETGVPSSPTSPAQ